MTCMIITKIKVCIILWVPIQALTVLSAAAVGPILPPPVGQPFAATAARGAGAAAWVSVWFGVSIPIKHLKVDI